MFRYLTLAWDASAPDQAAVAEGLGSQILRHGPWHPALRRAGLHVFTTGTGGSNRSYPLGAEGVVLGKVFRKIDFDGLASPEAAFTPKEATAILNSEGRSLVQHHWGRYVAFLHSTTCASVLRDPTGTLPCFVLKHAGVTIVFSWLEDVLAALPGVLRPAVNWAALEAHIRLGALSGRATCLEGIRQVLPGERVRLLDGHGDVLWSAVEVASHGASPDPCDAMPVLRDTVRSCVRSWAGGYGQLLLRLSGGLDSSILLSCLTPQDSAAQITCLNYFSAGADSDERAQARLVATAFDRPLVERERTSTFRLDQVLAMARTVNPSNHIARMGASRMDAEVAAAHRATALFTGGGGDQLFFEFHRWWPAADYLRQCGFDRGLPGALMAAARLGRVSVWHTLHMALRERLAPAVPRHDAGLHLSLLNPAAGLGPDALDRHVHPALLGLAALPLGKQEQVRQLMQPIGYYEPFEQAAAPELVNPLLSQPLVELCLQWPTYLLTHGGRGRGLVRAAFADVLPPQIAWRRSKGGMEEHIKGILLANIDFARDLLLNGQLVQRGLLDRTRLELALSARPSAQQSRLTELHTYIGIEAWLSRWASPICPLPTAKPLSSVQAHP